MATLLASAETYLSAGDALVFARSVQAQVDLGEPLAAAVTDVIEAWRKPRRAGGVLWPQEVATETAVEAICRACAA